jgi:hypothetical protein
MRTPLTQIFFYENRRDLTPYSTLLPNEKYNVPKTEPKKQRKMKK